MINLFEFVFFFLLYGVYKMRKFRIIDRFIKCVCVIIMEIYV